MERALRKLCGQSQLLLAKESILLFDSNLPHLIRQSQSADSIQSRARYIKYLNQFYQLLGGIISYRQSLVDFLTSVQNGHFIQWNLDKIMENDVARNILLNAVCNCVKLVEIIKTQLLQEEFIRILKDYQVANYSVDIDPFIRDLYTSNVFSQRDGSSLQKAASLLLLQQLQSNTTNDDGTSRDTFVYCLSKILSFDQESSRQLLQDIQNYKIFAYTFSINLHNGYCMDTSSYWRDLLLQHGDTLDDNGRSSKGKKNQLQQIQFQQRRLIEKDGKLMQELGRLNTLGLLSIDYLVDNHESIFQICRDMNKYFRLRFRLSQQLLKPDISNLITLSQIEQKTASQLKQLVSQRDAQWIKYQQKIVYSLQKLVQFYSGNLDQQKFCNLFGNVASVVLELKISEHIKASRVILELENCLQSSLDYHSVNSVIQNVEIVKEVMNTLQLMLRLMAVDQQSVDKFLQLSESSYIFYKLLYSHSDGNQQSLNSRQIPRQLADLLTDGGKLQRVWPYLLASIMVEADSQYSQNVIQPLQRYYDLKLQQFKASIVQSSKNASQKLIDQLQELKRSQPDVTNQKLPLSSLNQFVDTSNRIKIGGIMLELCQLQIIENASPLYNKQ
ncbi:hypothetical protein MIR68_001238 [Amoeboaphelidium protococcarum]|nr:hypothetical protein MIR68_001238 [Amoeboaphelidium protococcarum]